MRTPAAMPLCLALLLAAVTGCAMEERVISTSFGFEPEGRRNSQPSHTSRSSDSSPEARGGNWSIALGQFAGDDHRARAERFVDQLADFANAEDLWVGPDSGGSMVYQGRYNSRNDPTAQANLRQWRQLVSTGQMRLPALMLVPVADRSASADASAGEFDLETHAHRGRFTLQIGMYDEDYGDDFRDAAERAAAILREDGWEAYYWHGPVRSTVAIGIFGEEVLDEDTPQRQQLMAIQQRFPHNSLNGRTIREHRGDQVIEQHSELVHLPGVRSR